MAYFFQLEFPFNLDFWHLGPLSLPPPPPPLDPGERLKRPGLIGLSVAHRPKKDRIKESLLAL